MTFRSVLIGEGSLVLQCADVLLGAGHVVTAMVSDGPDAKRWAASNRVPLFGSVADISRAIHTMEFDYLFSVVNYRILRPEILRAARHSAINYHDAPLPSYAGINATSWAILSGETMHGITWHVIADEIDTGDILVQRLVPIADSETSLSLNIKCYEAALGAFGDLVTGLDAGSITPRPQDTSKRTYFARVRVPPGAGFIDWNKPAGDVARLVRALDFGVYDNTLGTAKFVIGDVAYVCKRARVALDDHGTPGSIRVANAGVIRVACGVGALEIEAVTTLDGRPLPVAELVHAHQLAAGSALRVFDATVLASIEKTCTELAAHENFWVRRLAALTPAEHAFVASHGGVATRRQSVRGFAMPPALREAAGSAGLDPATVLVTLVSEYLSRMTGGEPADIAFTSDATVGLSAASSGFASEWVPLRLERRPGERLNELIERTGAELASIKKHATFSRDVIARRDALSTRPAELPIGLLIGSPTSLTFPAPVTFVVERDGDMWHLVFDEGRLSRDAGAEMAEHLRALIERLAAQPSVPLSEIALLTAAERQKVLVEWNATARDYSSEETLASIVEAQVARTPAAPAVTCGSATLTYAELNRDANLLARELRRHGAGPDVLVGVCVERSTAMMVALLAIIKSGAAYVPLDPYFPADRIAYMLEDSALTILITQSSVRATLPPFRGVVLSVDEPTWPVDDATTAQLAEAAANAPVAVAGEHLAYVIYTSGSTGRPKGVMVSRRALVNLLWSMREWLALSDADRLLAVTTISFDIAGLDLWLPLLVGAHTVFASREAAADGEQLRALIDKHDITFLQATPITWRQLVDAAWPGKRDLQAVCTGEAMPPEVAASIVPRVGKLWNLYGPTETTIWSTGVEVREPTERISIGKPVANTQCYILDPQRQPVPVGMIGELYIGGDGLARGYLKRPDLDAEKFVSDPFSTASGARMYRTGDLAKFRADGTIECLGRTDHQVKIRGFRIELGEIESVLLAHADIQQAVVVAREDVPGEKRLVAYVVTNRPQGMDVGAMRAWAKRSLPEYMVPAAVVTMQEIPLTANGKIDRRALPAPDASSLAESASLVLPRTHVEKQLSDIWQELFNAPAVSVTDNFFDLGGHSILAVKMMARIHRVFGKRLPLNALFESPTVAQLAKYIEDASRTLGVHSLVSIQAAGSRPPIFWIPGGAALGLFRLSNIVTRLGPEQPVYGLGSNHPDSLSNVESVEERSRNYLELVRRVQPHGPYSFAGFCAGGRVAYEMARQLSEAGEQVAFVGMIDCSFPNYPTGPFSRFLVRAQRLRYQLRNARSRGVGLVAYIREKLALRRSAAAKRQAIETASAADADARQQQRDNDRLLDVTAKVFNRYRPRPFAGRISLFVSDDEEYLGVSKGLDARLHWMQMAGASEVRAFPGGHGEVFGSTDADGFPIVLQRALEDAYRVHGIVGNGSRPSA